MQRITPSNQKQFKNDEILKEAPFPDTQRKNIQKIKESTPKDGDKKIRMFPTPYQSIQKPPTFEVRSNHSHNSSISRSDYYNSVEREQHSVLKQLLSGSTSQLKQRELSSPGTISAQPNVLSNKGTAVKASP